MAQRITPGCGATKSYKIRQTPRTMPSARDSTAEFPVEAMANHNNAAAPPTVAAITMPTKR